MSELPNRPDLDQLKRQARELQRAGTNDLTLAQAQLTVARQYGFASWPRLKRHVESIEREVLFVLRYVRTPDELRRLWTQLFTIVGEPDADPERRAHWKIFERFDEQRHRMLLVEHEGATVGGALGLHLLALDSDARGRGIGRRLLEAAEIEAMADGEDAIHLHADPESVPFFRHLGYHEHGASHLHLRKGAPSGRLRARYIQRWREANGDLERGVLLSPR